MCLRKVIELEASHGNPEALAELRKEIGNLRNRAESLEVEVQQKDRDIEILKKRLDEHVHIYSTSQKVEDKLKVCTKFRNKLSLTYFSPAFIKRKWELKNPAQSAAGSQRQQQDDDWQGEERNSGAIKYAVNSEHSRLTKHSTGTDSST